MAQAPIDKAAFAVAVQDTLTKLPLLFKPGKPITAKESKSLEHPQVQIAEILDYAGMRGVLSLDAANAQIQSYISHISPDRKLPFRSLIQQGMKLAEETQIDSASAIGSIISGSKESTLVEKMLGIDLYIAQQLELERLRENGEA